MVKKTFLFLLVLWASSDLLKSQDTAPSANPKIENNFGYPLEGVRRFTGNYGEIRPNHFHAGIDFSTDAVKNIPIHSIGDGYVSRIKIATGGYGKVLYVTHPNGYVSVYAHEHHFAKNIQDYTRAEQQKQETFEIELFPKPTDLPVKKGEVIGYTGNTGNTTGPHLHFEIREEKTEVPLNPQLFLDFEDTEAPVCYKMAIYRIHSTGEPDYIKEIDVPGLNTKNEITLSETLLFPDRAGLAFSCFDKEAASGSRNQVYEIQILIDGQDFYRHSMKGISFEHTKYINWFVDQQAGRKKDKLQKCFKTGNNELEIFSVIKNNAVIDFKDYNPATLHNAIITFKDIKGNRSVLKFKFKTDEENGYEDKTYTFSCLKKNEFHLNGLDVTIPEKTLFYDVNFDCRILKSSAAGYFSPLFKIHSSEVNILKDFEIQIVTNNYPKGKEDKLCLVQMNDDLTDKSYAGGEFKNGKVTGNVKNLGLYAVGIDTAAPVIKENNPAKKTGKKIANAHGIYFTVSDNFSGIGNFRMEINGKWVLAEYEHKKKMIFYLFDDETLKDFTAELKVWDKKKNVAVFKKKYTR